ncbi:serine/threonine-protein phosphatase 4 regulatory subunit 4-like [Salarias fasciatus]|uniref:serine/threonine-protein phosphatase 4 regulatory subunit 4-like n=1 Tax=Salarias fasciatus TaxID=181472 RepID=UPI001176E0DA|nr:serine/threonine-protein phosphatase 4 regulatory subunit 4-like [Salarias fasciatus]
MYPGRMALNPAGLWRGPPEEPDELELLEALAFTETPIRRSLKTAEEMDQLTVDEDLNDMDRAVQLLSGQEVQRLSVLGNLPGLVRQNPAETFRRVVPKVREVLNGGGAEIQLTAAASFSSILQDDIILIHTHTFCILRTVLLQLGRLDAHLDAQLDAQLDTHLRHQDTVVFNAWLETLLLAINALPKETIKQEVLSPLLYHSQTSHSLQSRLASCRILGKVASKFESHMVKQELLPLARSLCRDSESEVRALMCRQLESLARVSGAEDVLAELLQEVVLLSETRRPASGLAASRHPGGAAGAAWRQMRGSMFWFLC